MQWCPITTPKLTGNRCQCPTCGEYFTSTRAFDRHRVGQFGPARRCLTVAEMDAAVFARNARGFRGEPCRERAHFDIAGPRGTPAMGLPGPEPDGLKCTYLEAAA